MLNMFGVKRFLPMAQNRGQFLYPGIFFTFNILIVDFLKESLKEQASKSKTRKQSIMYAIVREVKRKAVWILPPPAHLSLCEELPEFTEQIANGWGPTPGVINTRCRKHSPVPKESIISGVYGESHHSFQRKKSQAISLYLTSQRLHGQQDPPC